MGLRLCFTKLSASSCSSFDFCIPCFINCNEHPPVSHSSFTLQWGPGTQEGAKPGQGRAQRAQPWTRISFSAVDNIPKSLRTMLQKSLSKAQSSYMQSITRCEHFSQSAKSRRGKGERWLSIQLSPHQWGQGCANACLPLLNEVWCTPSGDMYIEEQPRIDERFKDNHLCTQRNRGLFEKGTNKGSPWLLGRTNSFTKSMARLSVCMHPWPQMLVGMDDS